MDGGIDVDIKVGCDGTLSIKTIQDGIVELGTLDHYSMKLERFRNVQYFDYIANDELFKVVRARSKNEAKVIAWHESCYRNHNIDPGTFKVWEYDGPYIITRDPKLSDDIMKTQMLLCEEYDKEYGD